MVPCTRKRRASAKQIEAFDPLKEAIGAMALVKAL